MNKADIIGVAEDLGRFDINADTIDEYLGVVLSEVCRRFGAPLMALELFEVRNDVSDYSTPDNAARIVAIFHNDRMLSASTRGELEAYDDAWRALSGDPWAFMVSEQSVRRFRMVPQPDSDSGDFSFITGTPLGTDFPTNAGSVIYTDLRITDIPDWLVLHVAFKILELEFGRPSRHQDIAFAKACAEFAEILWKLAGLL